MHVGRLIHILAWPLDTIQNETEHPVAFPSKMVEKVNDGILRKLLRINGDLVLEHNTIC